MYKEQEEQLISAILDSPVAPGMIARMQNALELERIKREKFYQDIDDDLKAEFINGEIIVHSPVKIEHVHASTLLLKLMDTYVQVHSLGWTGFEKVMTSFTRNDYEPDLVFFNSEKSKDFKKGQWKFPVPDLVVEILSQSTESRDRGIKFKDFEEHGVNEYWIIDAEAEIVEQYLLVSEQFHLKLKASEGHIKSVAIDGFQIDIRAIFNREINLQELKRMM